MSLKQLSLRDLIAIVLGIIILVVFGYWYFPHRYFHPLNGGMGPDWECIYKDLGGPVCVKKTPSSPNP